MDTSTGAEQAGNIRLASPTGRWVLLATVLASSMALLDTTVVNVALPSLGHDLGASVAGLQWTVTGYVLTLASFLLLGGALGDRFGRRRVFVVGVCWFTAASVLCAAAPGIGWLVAARALQGVGGALMTPGSLALLSATLAPEDRGRAIGAWAGLGGAASAFGPLLGGYLVEALSWRWVFWINVPSAVVVVVVALRHVPESADPARGPRHPLDAPGALLGAAGLAGLTYALIAAPTQPFAAGVLLPGGAGVLALIAFVVRERRIAAPMVPPAMFAASAFRIVNLVTFFVYAALAIVLVFLALTLQQQAGFSAAAAGSATLPFTAMLFAFSSRVGALASRIGPRLPMTLGPLLLCAGALTFTRISASTSYVPDVLPGILLVGTGMTLTVAPLTATALSTAPPGTTGLASGINNAVARTAGLLSVAVAPLIVGLSGRQYQEPAAVGRAFDRAMLLVAGLAVAAAATTLVGLQGERVRPGRGTSRLRQEIAEHAVAGEEGGIRAGAGDLAP